MLDELSVTTASMALAVGIFSVAVGLLLWLRLERSNRGENLSEADLKYFARQDVRRNLGLGILLLLAQGFAISPQVERRVAGRPSLLFLAMWLVIFALVLFLLTLAFLDMMATRVYAKRHREAILRERRALVSEIEQIAQRHRNEEEGSAVETDSTQG